MTAQNMTGYPSIDKPWLKYYTDEARSTLVPECTAYSFLLAQSADCMERAAINYFGNRISYREMFSKIDRAAAAFAALGVQRGDIVSLCMLTAPETVYVFYALNKLGAISNIIEPRVNVEQIRDRINATNSKLLIMTDVLGEKLSVILDELCVDAVVNVPLLYSARFYTRAAAKLFRKINGWKPSPGQRPVMTWKAFLAESRRGAVPPEAGYIPQSLAAIEYTGGTTGVPKGAMIPNEAFVAMGTNIGRCYPDFYQGTRFLDIMPPFIAYGLLFGLFIPFCSHLENVLIPRFTPESFGKLIRKYRPSHVVGVPSFFEGLIHSNFPREEDLSCLISAITGGDRLIAASEDEINRFLRQHNGKRRVLKGYGMTELGSAATFTVCDACNKEGSVGIPLLGNEVKIVMPGTQEELPYHQQGEICVHGPTTMLGYYKNAQETDAVRRLHKDGKVWIHTKDIGYMDEDGVLFVVDRIKRMIIRPDGHNVFPSQIEAVLARHPQVEACCVVGAPNPNGENGKIPTAFITRTAADVSDEQLILELDKLSHRSLAERDVALAYHVIEHMPLTLGGKVDYRTLERMAAEFSD